MKIGKILEIHERNITHFPSPLSVESSRDEAIRLIRLEMVKLLMFENPRATDRLMNKILDIVLNEPEADAVAALEACIYGFKKAKETMRHMNS